MDDMSEHTHNARFIAAKRGDVETGRAAIHAGADVNAKDHEFTTPLHWAALNGNIAIARLLIDNGAEGDASNLYLTSPLH